MPLGAGKFVKAMMTVGDSATICKMAGLAVRGVGCEGGCGSVDGLPTLTGDEMNLILTDLDMPDMDGLERTRRVRALANYAVVLLTAESQPQKKPAGATAWIVKPLNPDQLPAILKKVIP